MVITKNRSLLLLSSFILVILFGLRDSSNGRDIMTYYRVLNDLPTWLPHDYELEIQDNLFYKVLTVLGARSLALQGFIFSMTALLVGWCTYLIYRSKLDIGLTYVMFFCSTLFAFQLSGFRYFTAFLIVLTAVERLQKWRIWLFILAILIHPLISVFVVIFFYYKIFITKKVVLLTALITIIGWQLFLKKFLLLYDVPKILNFYGYNDLSGVIGLFPYLVLANIIALNKKTLILSIGLIPVLALPGSHRIFWFLPLFMLTIFYKQFKVNFLRNSVIQGSIVVLFIYYLFSIYGTSKNEIIPIKYENSSFVHL